MNNKKKRVNIIEFTGLPGAGKSTLVSEIIKELEKTGYHCYNHEQVFKNLSISNKWLNAIWYYLKNIKFTCLLFLYTFLSSPLAWRDLKYNFGRLQQLMKMIVMFEKGLGKARSSSVMVFDQGIVQCIWSITSLSGIANKSLLRRSVALKKHIFPGIIVYVQIDPGTAASRIAERASKCIFDSLSSAQTKELFSEQKCNFPIIISILGEVYEPAILTINGNGLSRDNVKTLSGQLKKILEDDSYRSR